MANTNTVLNTRGPGDSNTDFAAVTPAGAKANGNVAQYGNGGSLSGSQSITPRDTGSIVGTVPPGKSGIKLVSGVVQQATDLKVGTYPQTNYTGLGGAPDNVADNWLPATASEVITTSGPNNPSSVTDPSSENAAQHASAGKSLSPQHE